MTRLLPLLALFSCAESEPVDLDTPAEATVFTPVPVGYYVDKSISGLFTQTCGFDASEQARLLVQITDGVVSSSEEFLAAAQVLRAKLTFYGAAPTPLSTTCDTLLGKLEAMPRQGDCPDFTGAAIRTSNWGLAGAMNATQDAVDPNMVGAWCRVDLVGNAANDPRNIWWSVIYGMHNYTTAAVLHNDHTSSAIWRMRYFVPGAAASMYNAFLQNPMIAAGYPTGSLFQLSLSIVGASTNATTSTTPIALASSSDVWTVIDPDDEESIYALDAFVAAHVDQGALVDTGCSSASGFPTRRPTTVVAEGWSSLTFERGCR